MKFKKDDIVEVISADKWQGIDYPVGTQLRVCEDHEYGDVVSVYDSIQKPNGIAKLWEWKLKLVEQVEEEEEKEMKFRKGDIVEVINDENFYGVDYLVGTTWVVSRDQESGYSQVYVYDSNRKDRRCEAIFWDYNLKLVEQVEEPQEQKEMKVKAFDLNNLTTSELREYVELVEDKENAEFLLECFIEKVSK